MKRNVPQEGRKPVDLNEYPQTHTRDPHTPGESSARYAQSHTQSHTRSRSRSRRGGKSSSTAAARAGRPFSASCFCRNMRDPVTKTVDYFLRTGIVDTASTDVNIVSPDDRPKIRIKTTGKPDAFHHTDVPSWMHAQISTLLYTKKKEGCCIYY